jgi:hypothetical protein
LLNQRNQVNPLPFLRTHQHSLLCIRFAQKGLGQALGNEHIWKGGQQNYIPESCELGGKIVCFAHQILLEDIEESFVELLIAAGLICISSRPI